MDKQKNMLYLTRYRRAKKRHLLELEKSAFYKLYFDVQDYEKVFLTGGGVCLIIDRDQIVAFREGEQYFEVDNYSVQI